MPQSDLAAKTTHLRQTIAELDRVGVAYSGGVDSTLLLAVCREVLGTERVVALTAQSELTPTIEQQLAVETAEHLGAPHRVIHLDVLSNPDIAANRSDRCYHCKRAVFTRLQQAAHAEGMAVLVHGANADDTGDYRPGMRAAEEIAVRAPLLEAGFTKADVRALSRKMGLPTWDLPSMACLASRVPYDTPLTTKVLTRIEAAESVLREQFGLRQLRVRDHFPLARIEVPEADVARLAQLETREEIVQRLQDLGYRYVALDLQGFRSGSLNEILENGKQSITNSTQQTTNDK
jgi:uncharacterized protein